MDGPTRVTLVLRCFFDAWKSQSCAGMIRKGPSPFLRKIRRPFSITNDIAILDALPHEYIIVRISDEYIITELWICENGLFLRYCKAVNIHRFLEHVYEDVSL